MVHAKLMSNVIRDCDDTSKYGCVKRSLVKFDCLCYHHIKVFIYSFFGAIFFKNVEGLDQTPFFELTGRLLKLAPVDPTLMFHGSI